MRISRKSIIFYLKWAVFLPLWTAIVMSMNFGIMALVMAHCSINPDSCKSEDYITQIMTEVVIGALSVILAMNLAPSHKHQTTIILATSLVVLQLVFLIIDVLPNHEYWRAFKDIIYMVTIISMTKYLTKTESSTNQITTTMD